LTSSYVARYVRHPAIADSRIEKYDGEIVNFCFDDERYGRTRVIKTANDFIASLIQHIPPKNFKMIRYYGLYSRNNNYPDMDNIIQS